MLNAITWLAKHNITLEEGFAQALSALAMDYQKKNNIRNLDDVYRLIGVRKQLISHWKKNPCSTQTKNF